MISNNSSKILSVASKKDLKNDRKRISENNHAINEEQCSAENLENYRKIISENNRAINEEQCSAENLENDRKIISENNHAINEEISSAENLENDRGDILLYDNRVQRRELGQRLLNRWTSQLDLGCTTGRLERVVSVHNST